MREKYTRLRNTTIKQLDNQTITVFQPIIPENFYPHLPIHMFTQNLSAMKNISKLILLGNGFFGDEKWGLQAIGNSPNELSKLNKQTHAQSFANDSSETIILSISHRLL